MHLRPICALTTLTVTIAALTATSPPTQATAAAPTSAVVISDPSGDVVGGATQAATIDVSKVTYRLKGVRDPHDIPAFSVRVRYRKILLAEVGRQSFVSKIQAGGDTYALVMHANGYDSAADIYRVTDKGWQQTPATVSHTLNTFGGKGILQASVPARFFRTDSIDRVQTTLRLRDEGGRAVDRTRPHLSPISLMPEVVAR